MDRSRREQIVLGVLLVVLATVGYRAWRSTAVRPRAASNSSTTAPRAGRGRAALTAPDVHLQALRADAPAPDSAGRDLFRFGARAPAPRTSAPRPTPSPPPANRPPTASTGTGSASAAITLKFIGIVEASDSDARIAVLSDGRGAPMYGREGDTIAGQYRILRIGTESIEMAYLDGHGRQTIRLSGS